ncbi:MAG TPA: maleylpyruvate isomerase family mycothiol-dependent enzyme [Pseudonocardia sp.]|jgi:maleylpyruvate isomerase
MSNVVNPMRDQVATLGWMREGTAFAVGLVDKLTDEELRQPSALPDWTRAHVVAHLARNAEAIGRLARWARTGVETPMYPSYHQRNLDIELSARRDASTLRAELTDTAAGLARELDELDEAGWGAVVRTAQGAEVPSTVLPWMRAREVWLHGVDLDAGGSLDALPSDLAETLLENLAAEMSTKEGCPGARLLAHGGDTPVPLGGGGPTEVRGSATDLVGWLSGRSGRDALTATLAGHACPVPDLPRWL